MLHYACDIKSTLLYNVYALYICNAIYIMQYIMYNLGYTSFLQCKYYVPCAIYDILCTIYDVLFTIYDYVQYMNMYNIWLCAIYDVLCTIYDVLYTIYDYEQYMTMYNYTYMTNIL